MIHFFFGRSGQTWPCAARLVRQARDEGKPVFLLVPQQYTLSAERMLIRHFGTEGFFDVDVLSPSRLRQRVFSRAGGSDRIRIDSLGKAMTVARVLEREKAPFMRATYVNQARVHMGYHYPRSLTTAMKSAGYFRRFCEDFDFCIFISSDYTRVSFNYTH